MGKRAAVSSASLLLVLLLAGCSGSGDDTSTSGTIATSGSISTRGPGGENNPPTGKVEASVAAGMAPLRVDFTLDGSDRDGDPLSWSLDANGDGKADRSGTSLPTIANYTYLSPGLYNVTFTLSDQKADFAIPLSISVTANTAQGTPLLFDGAEGDASLWTLHDELVVDANAGTGVPSGAAHPVGGWFQDAAVFRTGAKSWHSHYPDNLVATLTTAQAIEVPEGGATLSFYAKGGAEDNSFDGLWVNVGSDVAALENIIYQAVVFEDWTQFSYRLEPGPQFVQFLFKSDISCSSEPQPVGGPGACGAGWDEGGFWVDDIQVI